LVAELLCTLANAQNAVTLATTGITLAPTCNSDLEEAFDEVFAKVNEVGSINYLIQ